MDLPNNIICYADDISIPHAWRTTESHNNKFYIILETEYLNGSETLCNWEPYVSFLPEGNYTGSDLVTAIQELLYGFADTFTFEVTYHPARGVISIEEKPEGVNYNNKFFVPSDFGKMNCMSNIDSDYPWKDIDGNVQTVYV